MKQCDYCAKEISYHEQYCCEECRQKYARSYDLSQRFAKPFMYINVLCVFGIPIGLFFMSLIKPLGAGIASGSCLLLGIMLLLLPFPTEGMIKKFKMKKAILITRMIGLGVIALGAVIAGLLFFVFK